MAIFRFLRTPKHQNFEYIPRHFDPQQEELEERVRQLENRDSDNPEDIKARISGGLRGKRNFGGARRVRSKSNFRTNIVLLTIFILLVFFTYIMIQVYLPQLEEFLK